MTKFAIPSNVVRDWLASEPSSDPPPPTPGAGVADLLAATQLTYEDEGDGNFSLPYDNDITVQVHQYEEFFRVYVALGELPGADEASQYDFAVQALRFNYSDPVGRLSLWEHEGSRALYWEAQVPMAEITADFARTLAQTAANQAERWQLIVAGEDPPYPLGLYPGGEDEELLARLEQLLGDADLAYEVAEGRYLLPYDNDIWVTARVYEGMGYIYCYVGGMPGETDRERGEAALAMLKLNWVDPFGRLALDADYDVVWEAQVPMDFLGPDYLALLGATCATQAAEYVERFGE